MSNDKAKSDKNNKSKKDNKEDIINNTDLLSLSKQELLSLGKSYNLKSISSLTKNDLIEKIKEYLEKQEEKIPDYKKSPFSNHSKQQLSDLAKEYKIKNYSRMSKVELIKSIDKHVETKNNPEENKVEEKSDTNKETDNENKLESLNMSSLVGMAKDLKIKGYSKLSKLKLIKSINEITSTVSEKIESIKENISESSSGLSETIEGIKNTVVDKVSDLKETLTDTTENLSKTVIEVKQNITEKVEDLKENIDHLKENIIETTENISTNIAKTKDAITYIASEMKDAFNKDPNEVKEESNQDLNKEIPKEDKNILAENESAEKPDSSELNDKDSEDNLTEKEKLNKLVDNAETIEKIAQKTELVFTDRREANAVEEELKHKILLTPSKFGFGKTNEEYLLKDEESLELPELYEEDKIVLLPVDPTKMFVYWDISTPTINKLINNNIQEFYLKINDVTGIIYNGSNANSFYMEKCRIDLGNWYLALNEGGKNFCVELGHIAFGTFNLIARSNTIMVPPGQPSNLISDTFVITTYVEKYKNDEDNKGKNIQIENNKDNYYNLDTYKISKNFNVEKMATKMPIFSFEEIHPHFVEEYKIQNEIPVQTNNKVDYKLPQKLKVAEKNNIDLITQNNIFKNENINPVLSKSENKSEFHLQHQDEVNYNDTNNYFTFENEKPQFYSVGAVKTKEKVSPKVTFKEVKRNIPGAIYSYFEELPNFSDNKILIDNYFYRLPGEPQKAMRVYYEWTENNVPYKKEFFWISDVYPQVHQNIYKISWGPTWIKEFVGGSEQLRYIGASERFLGSSDIYLGGSEYFIESSGRFLGGSEEFIGGSDNLIKNKEYIRILKPGKKYFDWNDFIGSSDNLGGSENIQKIEEMQSIFSDEFINKNIKVKINDYKGIKNRYRL